MQDIKFSVVTDPVTEAVHVECSGFWSLEEAKRYLDQIAEAIGEARSRNSRVRVLVDCRKASVQALELINELSDMISRAYKPEDRLAIVVESQLLKRQMDRLPTVAVTRIFASLVSLELATDWLMSDSKT